MKIITTLSCLAAFAGPSAFFLLPTGGVIAGSLLCSAGFAAIVASEYSPQLRPLRVEPALAGRRVRKERFGLAA